MLSLLRDEAFVAYMRQQNIDNARAQIDALNLLMKYVEDEGLLPLDQADVRRRCYREWNLPDPGDEACCYSDMPHHTGPS
jgi:hypothetical protein